MPRWDVHISFGLMALIVIVSALVLGVGGDVDISQIFDRIYLFSSILLLGGGALIIGSILPDIDGKGKIRPLIGPIVGSMLLIPLVIGALRAGGPQSVIDLIFGYGSVVFMVGTVAGYLFLLIPKKHRGLWHSNKAGLFYGSIWGSYVFFASSLAMDQSVMIGTMGSLGYGWHLALDGRLI